MVRKQGEDEEEEAEAEEEEEEEEEVGLFTWRLSCLADCSTSDRASHSVLSVCLSAGGGRGGFRGGRGGSSSAKAANDGNVQEFKGKKTTFEDSD